MKTSFARIERKAYWALLAAAGGLLLIGLGAARYMEEHGHSVTGMSNQVVWGMPHVFAIFLIVAASGVLNVASVGSVFGQPQYKARAPLSALLSIAMLAGGLTVLMLDLGRPERVVVAATRFNFRSVFAWNVFLYSGMFGVVAVYLWTLLERRLNPLSARVGLAAFVWRFILTTGTGSIFGFLVARQAYQSALLAPMFIVLSLAWGLAVFLVVQAALYAWNGRQVPAQVQARMARLLGIFVAASAYFVLVYHLTNLYWARQWAFESFILVEGGIYPALFWFGYALAGTVAPMAILFTGGQASARASVAASLLVLAGAFALLYVFVIGGQAYPLDIFPGYAVRSAFFDGAVASYAPSLPEVLLGVGGLALSLLITAVCVRLLRLMPQDEQASTTATAH